MLFGDQKLYDEARAAKLGQIKLPEPLEELRRWASERYSVKIVHIVFDRLEHSNNRPRLNLIFENAADVAKVRGKYFLFEANIHREILEKFTAVLGNQLIDEILSIANTSHLRRFFRRSDGPSCDALSRK